MLSASKIHSGRGKWSSSPNHHRAISFNHMPFAKQSAMREMEHFLTLTLCAALSLSPFLFLSLRKPAVLQGNRRCFDWR